MNIEKLKQHQSDIPYIMVSREVIQCLGIDALAIWAYLQSLPDDWKIREQQVRSRFSLSRARWLKAMKELREAGLYSVERLKDDAGNFTGSHFHIYAFPQVRKPTLMENDTCITEEDSSTEKDIPKEKDNGDLKSPKPHKWTEEDRQVASDILEAVQVIAPSQKGGKSWPDDIRKMREIDKRSHEEIMGMFEFANTHKFWKVNILSPKTLREQWVRLEAERNKNVRPKREYIGPDVFGF